MKRAEGFRHCQMADELVLVRDIGMLIGLYIQGTAQRSGMSVMFKSIEKAPIYRQHPKV